MVRPVTNSRGPSPICPMLPKTATRCNWNRPDGVNPLWQNTVHYRRVTRHRARDWPQGRTRRRERRHCRQNRRAQSQAAGHDLFVPRKKSRKPGGKALPLAVDVRDEEQLREALERTAATFGGLDIVVNNASAISLTDSQATDMKRFDLMQQINARGTFMASKFALPYLEKAGNPHILILSPPLSASLWPPRVSLSLSSSPLVVSPCQRSE